VACLAVVVYHSTNVHAIAPQDGSAGAGLAGAVVRLLHGLWAGVPVFFVISGYCISATADSTRRRPHGIGTYFLRRFRRIYPPFWVALGASMVFLGPIKLFITLEPLLEAVYPPLWFSPSQWVGNLTLTESWRHHVFGDPRGYFVGVIWTLCYEEQFYAVTGLLLLTQRRHFFRGASLVAVATVLAGVASERLGFSIGGFFFDGFWLLFAAGIMVYYDINYATRRQSWLIKAAFVVGILLTFSGVPLIHAEVGHAGYQAPVGLTFALLILLLRRWDDAIVSSIIVRPLLYFGTICYSMYLVHLPVVRVISLLLYQHGTRSSLATLCLTVPVCVAASIIAASLFHFFVERRFLNTAPSAAGACRWNVMKGGTCQAE
jgi:peptidoglycan/LPS O-acetylase OafA/YrhL